MHTSETPRVAIIGSGNMGGALVRGWAAAVRSGLAPLHLTATARTQATLDRIAADCPEVSVTLDNIAAVTAADIVVIAVKPWLVADVIDSIRPALAASAGHPIVVSVAAGITSDQLHAMVGGSIPCVYAMPNIAAEFGASMTFVESAPAAPASTPATTPSATEAVESAARLFGYVGAVQVVPSRLMAPGMMMAGSGIAYVMRFLRAMMEGGVEMGFYPADARRIALQTMQGAVTLLEATGLHPEVAIDRVTTPGGITIKGLNQLDHSGFNSAVIKCLKAGL